MKTYTNSTKFPVAWAEYCFPLPQRSILRPSTTSCCENPLPSQEAIFLKKPLPHSTQLKSAVTMVNISDLIGTTSNWTAVSWVQQALFISPYCVRTLHQPTLFFCVKWKKISHEYKVMLPYKIMQFCSWINFMKFNKILHINFIYIKSSAIWDEAPSFWLHNVMYI